MGQLHFQKYLSPAVQLLNIVGTESGNPTSDVLYGFVNQDTSPQAFAVAMVLNKSEQEIRLELPVPAERVVACVGTLTLDEYRETIVGGKPFFVSYMPAWCARGSRMLCQATVPPSRPSEDIIAHQLRMIFDIRENNAALTLKPAVVSGTI